MGKRTGKERFPFCGVIIRRGRRCVAKLRGYSYLAIAPVNNTLRCVVISASFLTGSAGRVDKITEL